MAKRGYHHGNLRQALVETALTLIEARGPAGFTLSEAARQAGVTPAAVYRHFGGRDDLIAEAAQQGYLILAEVMEEACRHDQPSALAGLAAVGRAYLTFAERHPGHYIAMFESGISINRTPELARVALRARTALDHATEAVLRRIPPGQRPPPAMFAAHLWALSHGVVELFARAGPAFGTSFSPDELLERGIGIYLRGLGGEPGDE